MHSGWVTSQKFLEDNGFMRFRRYGISGNDKNPLPNLIIFNCSKDVNKTSHLTFILPQDFPVKSFPRSEWLPQINVRFRINDKLSVPMPGEYHDGEFYFDLNNDTRDNFEKIMSADKLAMGFGDKNDVIQFEFTEKIDQLFSAVIKKLPWMGEFTHYSRAGDGSVIEACEAYQQRFLSDQQSVSSGESAVKPAPQGDGQSASELTQRGTSISIPLRKEGGTYVVPVLINNAITLGFVVDSGAADVTIPSDVVSTLLRTGTIGESDFIGTQTYRLADGTKLPSVRFRLRSLKVGEMIIEDVIAGLAPGQGALLLGQSFLSRFQSWAIDNNKHELLLSANADSQPANNLKIIDSSVDLFDRLCIEQAYDKNLFYSVIQKLAQRKLSSEEYKQFLFSPALSADFYSVPVSNKVGDIVVGRTSYKQGGHNCVVGFKADIKLALRRWMDLYNKKYATKAELQVDKGAPLYLLEQGLFKKSVLVQIANLGNGFVEYYAYFE
jgi:aspartyl protease family protein